MNSTAWQKPFASFSGTRSRLSDELVPQTNSLHDFRPVYNGSETDGLFLPSCNKRLLFLAMLSSLEALCCDQTPYFLLTPSWVKDKSALAQLLLQESLGYHEVELEVCRRQLCEIEREEKRLRAQIEVESSPRTGEAFQIRAPGHQDVLSEQAHAPLPDKHQLGFV